MKFLSTFIYAAFAATVLGQKDPNFVFGRNGIVHLFEWKYSDIALECERFLAPKGFAGVQISPPTENIIAENRPWWERYQPVSYKLVTRSGTEQDLANMISRCNNVGIRIYADIIINHMAGFNGVGTAGSLADSSVRDYPGVPYTDKDFHNPICGIQNYQDPLQVRNCELSGLRDLNQTIPYVRDRVVELLNRLVDLGMAGFRFDAAKHMWPRDLAVIYERIKPLNTRHGFKRGAKPFIYQEVIDLGNEKISKDEYTSMGVVTEFSFSDAIGRVFRGLEPLKKLKNFGPEWGFMSSQDALVFVDNHDNQRGHGAGGANILTFRNDRLYKMATAFKLAYPYGIVRVMSSYYFSESETDLGPPKDSATGNIISPSIQEDGSCARPWICEHRWRQIANMINFRQIAGNAPIQHWWDNGNNQIAFGRGNRTFVAWNGEKTDLKIHLQTGLPRGTYCDIISGNRIGNDCLGLKIHVSPNGTAEIDISKDAKDGVIAIHIESLVSDSI
ncbi:hypothetical protein HA402_000667 [Bradysia odoriphaga]|nr:hypothetical protein HA402_000667 [Bradysia odoriphaga]